MNRRNQPVTASGKADDNLVSVGTVEEKDAVRASAALSRERIKVVQVSGLGSVGLLVSANEEQRARTILGREAKAHGIKILPSDH